MADDEESSVASSGDGRASSYRGLSARDMDDVLREALGEHRLVGELRISEDDLGALESQIDALVGSGMTANRLGTQCPALLVVYLTNVGVYRYAAANYWPNVAAARRFHTSALGSGFKRAVSRLGLETFDDLVWGESATEYVARILAHGGIPRYCLGDYFTALYRDLRHTGDLLSLWRTRQERLVNIDKPVGRFLRYSGEVAVDFVNRSIELVQETNARGVVPDSVEISLPDYLVDEYPRWRRRITSPALVVPRAVATRRGSRLIPGRRLDLTSC